MFVPTAPAFLYHWYDGDVPPFTGVAVKVTDVPAHTGLADAPIVTLTGRIELTVIVIAFDVDGDPVRHGVAFEVITTVIMSPSARVDEVYVELFAPGIFAPPFFHW